MGQAGEEQEEDGGLQHQGNMMGTQWMDNNESHVLKHSNLDHVHQYVS